MVYCQWTVMTVNLSHPFLLSSRQIRPMEENIKTFAGHPFGTKAFCGEGPVVSFIPQCKADQLAQKSHTYSFIQACGLRNCDEMSRKKKEYSPIYTTQVFECL